MLDNNFSSIRNALAKNASALKGVSVSAVYAATDVGNPPAHVAAAAAATTASSLADAETRAHETAVRYAAEVAAFIDRAFQIPRTLVAELAGLKAAGRVADRVSLNAMLRQALANEPEVLAIYTLWEPDALDGRDAESHAAARVRERDGLTWSQWASRVERYLRHLEMLFSPQLFIVGGGASKAADNWLPLIAIETDILPAAMANNAGIVGAALACRGTAGR